MASEEILNLDDLIGDDLAHDEIEYVTVKVLGQEWQMRRGINAYTQLGLAPGSISLDSLKALLDDFVDPVDVHRWRAALRAANLSDDGLMQLILALISNLSGVDEDDEDEPAPAPKKKTAAKR